MTRNQRDWTPDVDVQLKDAGLIAADDIAQVGGSDAILDLGLARVDGRVIVDASAIEVDTGDEKYVLHLQFSNSATFASVVHSGPALILGDQAAIVGVDTDTPAGRHELGFTNEINGVLYRYMRLQIDVTGTIATGINFTAWVALP
jgi:hypothetical protein